MGRLPVPGAGAPARAPTLQAAPQRGRDFPAATVIPALGQAGHQGRPRLLVWPPAPCPQRSRWARATPPSLGAPGGAWRPAGPRSHLPLDSGVWPEPLPGTPACPDSGGDRERRGNAVLTGRRGGRVRAGPQAGAAGPPERPRTPGAGAQGPGWSCPAPGVAAFPLTGSGGKRCPEDSGR